MSTGIGYRIKERRKELGLSQEMLAKRIGLKSKTTICKVERGDDNLTADTVAKYANALDCTPGYLMGWTEQSNDLFNKRVYVTDSASKLLDYKRSQPLKHDIEISQSSDKTFIAVLHEISNYDEQQLRRIAAYAEALLRAKKILSETDED